MLRREFLKTLAAGAIAEAALPRTMLAASTQPAGSPRPFLLSSTGCSRATAYPEASKIITWNGVTHVAWLDSVQEGFRVRIRTLDRTAGRWSPTYTIGQAYDNHGGPALTVDSKGHLHVAYGPHGGGPMRYRRSVGPDDASAWSDEIQFARRCTYPTLVCGPDDTLYLTCRERVDNPWGVNLYVKPAGEPWQGPTTVLRALKPGYAHFQEAMAWGPDHRTLHLSCRCYDGKPGRGHTVGYLRTRDFGRTWERADGTRVELPATAETITNVVNNRDRDAPGLQCGSIAVDSAGRVQVLYCSDTGTSLRAWIATLDAAGDWRHRPLLDEIEQRWPGRGITTPGGITIDGNDRIHVALTMVKPNSEDAEKIWGHPTSEILRLESGDDGSRFAAQLVSEPDPATPNWLPNLERPTGHNRVASPSLIYTAGTRAENNRQIVSNRVYWVG